MCNFVQMKYVQDIISQTIEFKFQESEAKLQNDKINELCKYKCFQDNNKR